MRLSDLLEKVRRAHLQVPSDSETSMKHWTPCSQERKAATYEPDLPLAISPVFYWPPRTFRRYQSRLELSSHHVFSPTRAWLSLEPNWGVTRVSGAESFLSWSFW